MTNLLTIYSSSGRKFTLDIHLGKITYTIHEPDGRNITHSDIEREDARYMMALDVAREEYALQEGHRAGATFAAAY